MAKELHAAENRRFAPIRQELLGFYGDDATPDFLDPMLLPCARRARDAQLVSDDFLLSLIDCVAIAQAARLPLRNATEKARLAGRVSAHRRELLTSVGLPEHDSNSEQTQLRAAKRPRGSELHDERPPEDTSAELQTTVAALTLLIAEMDINHKLKLDGTLKLEELIAVMATLEFSFFGVNGSECSSAMRWLELRAADKGWSVALVPQLDTRMRAESRCEGLNGKGPGSAAVLKRFRSPMELAAHEAFAGWGWARGRALQMLPKKCYVHLRDCISLAVESRDAEGSQIALI